MLVERMKKNKSIEFYRFMLSLPILLMHIGSSTALMGTKFSKGGNAVECFFVLSGFLLAYSLIEDDGMHAIRSSTKKLKRQITHIFPYYYICLATTFACKFYYYKDYCDFSVEEWGHFFNNFFIELLCLSGLSYRTFHVNGPAWYVSALLMATFVVSLVYLLLKKICGKKYKYFWMIGVILCFFIYLMTDANFSSKYLLVRSVINISLGVAFFEIFDLIKNKEVIVPCWFVDILEVATLIAVISCFIPGVNIDSRYIAIFFGILVIIQFSQKTHLSKILDNDISGFLGEISLPIYLGQMFIICLYAFWGNYDAIITHRTISYIVITSDVILWSIALKYLISRISNKNGMKFAITTKQVLLIVSGLLFIHSFYTEQIFFDMGNMNRLVYIVCKLLLLVIEVAVPQIIYKLLSLERKWLILFACIVVVYLFFIMVSWPGNWNNDEFLILGTVQHFNIQYHQSLLTSLFFILSLMIIPDCGGIILFQGIICALIATYTIYICYRQIGKCAYFLLAVFFSPLTIYYVLYPLRVCLYAFTFLLLMMLVAELIQDCYFSAKRMIAIGVISAIVSTWRTESLFLIVLIPMIIVVQIISKGKNKKFIYQIVLAAIIPFALLMKINSYKDVQTEKTATLWSFTTGMSVLLQDDNLRSPDLEEDLNNIDKVMNIDKMVENSSATDLYKVYNASGPYEYTNEEYNACIKSIARLIICNPIKYAETKWELFKTSCGIGESFWLSTPISKEQAYEIVSMYSVSDSILDIYNPRNENIREAMVYWLTGMMPIKDDGDILIYKVTMQSWIAELILFIVAIVMLFKKKLMYFLIDILVLGDFILVYLTAPNVNVMYFFPCAFVGICITLYEVICVFRSCKNKC